MSAYTSMSGYLKVKVYPETGPAFYVLVPDEVEDIDEFLDEHLKNVSNWDEASY